MRSLPAIAVASAAVAALILPGTASPSAAAGLEVKVLSNRADLVSGGDALVEVALPAHADPAKVRVHVNGRDVTSAFAVRPDGRFAGLVRGLEVGQNEVTARGPGGGVRLTIANHPIGGPVFAGRQVQPWICRAEENGLGPAQDAQCNAPLRYDYFYQSTDTAKRGFQPYDPANPPADVAVTTTDQGETVPFVVRRERGVIGRGIYAIAALSDPSRPWRRWERQAGWNGKVVWPFGGDCKPWHRQADPIDVCGEYPLDPDIDGVDPGVDEALGSIFGNGNAVAGLSRGFMVATSSLNKLGEQCNPVVSAEAVMMLKEHIVERYGEIRYTIGAGGSGGSMQQHLIAAAYPGLLNGIQPVSSFPDVWSVVNEAEDCHLLMRYFDTVSPHLWVVEAQRDAVLGTMGSLGCRAQFDGPHGLGTPVVGNYAGTWMDPAHAPGCGLPAELVYNPLTNPNGVRCTLQDYMASVVGRRAVDGFANRSYDNVGIRYGLRALESGTITPEQFADLNEKVGGLDIDWNHQPPRSIADPEALEVAYRAGLVNQGRELARVPILDVRGHDNYEIHADFHSHSMRDRLEQANGHHDNQVIFTTARPQAPDPGAFNAAFDLVDEWLARIEADDGDLPLEEKVRRNRPAAAVDTCWIEGRPVTDQATCRTAFPYFGDPRIAAGGPLADDILKCRLKPLDRGDYPVDFTSAQWSRLQKAFPGGVCDYRRPGVGQQPSVPWMTFADGPGGRPAGPAPISTPIR